MKKVVFGMVLFALMAVAPALFALEKVLPPPEVPVKGMVTMLDLGSVSCLLCKMMQPIMETLEKEYEGKAAILFIDVYKNPGEAAKYDIDTIPTQIFYDSSGKEASRHQGFMDAESIAAMFEKLGVKK